MGKIFRNAFRSVRFDNPKCKIANRQLTKIVGVVVALAMCGAVAQAQTLAKIPRIGALHLGNSKAASVPVEAFQRGLRDLGYVEGKNIIVEYRYADGERGEIYLASRGIGCL